jgi:hypothetical protein
MELCRYRLNNGEHSLEVAHQTRNGIEWTQTAIHYGGAILPVVRLIIEIGADPAIYGRNTWTYDVHFNPLVHNLVIHDVPEEVTSSGKLRILKRISINKLRLLSRGHLNK